MINRLLDTALVLAFLTAASYFFGLQFLQGYYHELGIPLDTFVLTPQDAFSSSWISFFWIIVVVIMAWGILLILRRIFPNILTVMKSDHANFIGILLILTTILFSFSRERGKVAAVATLKSNMLQRTSFILDGALVEDYRFLSFNADRYIFIKLSPENRPIETLILSSDLLKAVTIFPNGG